MQLRNLPRLQPFIIAPDPYGLGLKLKIWESSRPDFVQASEEMMARQAVEDTRKRTKAQFLIQTQTASGRTLSVKKQDALAEKAARIATGTDEDLVGRIRSLSKRVAAELVARWLFEIVEGNLYGEPLRDTPENRERLLLDLQYPADNQGASVWHLRNGGPPDYVHFPRLRAIDADRENEWLGLVAEHSLEDAEEAFKRAGGRVEPTPFFDEALVTEDDKRELLPLQDLLHAWVVTTANNQAAFVRRGEAEVADFLPEEQRPTSS